MIERDFKDLKSSANILLAALISGAPIIPLTLYSPLPSIVNLTLGALTYIIAYLTCIPLLRILDKGDLESLTHIFSKNTILKPIVKIISGYENKIIGFINK